jgi:hypothetical protein
MLLEYGAIVVEFCYSLLLTLVSFISVLGKKNLILSTLIFHTKNLSQRTGRHFDDLSISMPDLQFCVCSYLYQGERW